MDSTEFDRRYFAAFEALGTRLMTELWQAQHELQTLAKSLPAEADRLRADEKVHQLPAYFPSIFEPMSVERREAQLVLAAADHTTGTKQERLAAIAATRRKVFEIADRAGDDEALHPRPDASPRTPRRQSPRSALALQIPHGRLPRCRRDWYTSQATGPSLRRVNQPRRLVVKLTRGWSRMDEPAGRYRCGCLYGP